MRGSRRHRDGLTARTTHWRELRRVRRLLPSHELRLTEVSMRFGRILVVSLIALTVAGRAMAEEKGSCSGQCGSEAEQAYHQCIDQGGGEEDCKQAAEQTFQGC